MKKNVLITGGLGFIGCHCIKKWHSLGFNVFVIDNLSTNAISENHQISKLCKDLYITDILSIDWGSLPKLDLIIHLASPVGPVGVLKHSGNMANIILQDIYKVINGATHNNCPLIFVSTSEIYGYRENKSYLKEEDDKVLKGAFTVRNEYSIAKLLAEIALANKSKILKDLRYQIIRPFNVSGEYQLPDGGFVLPRFVNQAISGQDITVYNTGKQIRAFTWVNDIVDGIYLTSISNKHWNSEWNIGNEANERTILYIAEKVKEYSNSESKITHVDPISLHGPLFSEAPEKIPNSEKIRKLLGWSPTKSVEDVILEVINFYGK